MADDGAVRLRPARRTDWDLIRGWLARDDIEAWWGPRSATEAEVNIALNSEHALCRIIEAGGAPVGYAHAVDATMWGEDLPQDLEAGTWDLLKEEVFGTTFAVAVCVFPSVKNERAVRAYEKAGFRWKRIWNDPHMGPSWFMVAERPRR